MDVNIDEEDDGEGCLVVIVIFVVAYVVLFVVNDVDLDEDDNDYIDDWL